MYVQYYLCLHVTFYKSSILPIFHTVKRKHMPSTIPLPLLCFKLARILKLIYKKQIIIFIKLKGIKYLNRHSRLKLDEIIMLTSNILRICSLNVKKNRLDHLK